MAQSVVTITYAIIGSGAPCLLLSCHAVQSIITPDSLGGGYTLWDHTWRRLEVTLVRGEDER